MLSKNVFGIRDAISGRWWSRNKWGEVGSTPDLYESEAKARYQTDHPRSKMSLHNEMAVRYGRPAKCPEIIELLLTEEL